MMRPLRRLQCSLTPLRYHRAVHTAAANPFLRVSEEVREAVNSRKPVVALETTIYTHGFPYPENVALATELEATVRDNGGIPATIGILNGVALVGMSPKELEELTSSVAQGGVLKISRRDLAYACGTRLAGNTFNGGTTIAGTMVLAHFAGIRVFATGGLGGVHRGAESSMDISADLTELGRTPVTVISSGCKSFLDIGRTLEYLETEGVGVATFADGRQGAVDFPAFWARDSGFKSPMTIKDEAEAAAIIHAQSLLSLSSGLHFANPIPEAEAIPRAEIDGIIAQAVRDADEQGVSGKDNTPFILSRIKSLTQGKSIPANRALIVSNVARGTKVAKELARLESGSSSAPLSATLPFDLSPRAQPVTHHPSPPQSAHFPLQSEASVFVAGAIAVDLACDYSAFSSSSPVSTSPQLHTSNPAIITQSLGGVGYNVARAIRYLGQPVRFCTAVGDDLSGQAALSKLVEQGFSSKDVQITLPNGGDSNGGGRTAQYIAINDGNKDLVLAMADMAIFERPNTSAVEFDNIWGESLRSGKPRYVVVDANWDPSTAHHWLAAAKKIGAQTALEPVSVAKASRFFSFSSTSQWKLNSASDSTLPTYPRALIDIASPNALELSAMHSAARSSGMFDSPDWWRVVDALGISSAGARNSFTQLMPATLVDQGLPQQAIQLLPFIPCIVTKLGAEGVLLTELLRVDDPRLSTAEGAKFVLSRAGENDIGVGGVYMQYFPSSEVLSGSDVVSVNGVGDTFLGAIVAGLAKSKGEKRVEELIPVAQKAAILTLKSMESASPELESLTRLL